MMTRSTAALSVGLALLTGSAALADTVDVRFLGTNRGQNVRIHLNSNQTNVFAGQLRHELSNGTGIGAALAGQWITYCTDLTQYVTNTARTYTITDIAAMPTPPMGEAKAQAIANMYDFAAGAHTALDANSDFTAAFQIAVWEIVTDYAPAQGAASLNVTTGVFRATRTNGNALSSLIGGHLADLFGAIGGNASRDHLVGLTHGSAQDQLLELPASIIPLPGAAPLAAAGLFGLAASRRRRTV